MTVPAPDVSPACACVPVQELDDDAVGVAYLKRAFAPLLGPQWHRNGDAFGLQPGHFGPQVVHFEGEDEPGGVIVALVFGQHVHTAAPVAVMAWLGAPPVAEFAAAGAVRISLGSAIAQAAYAVAARAATELLTSGTYDSVADGIAYDTMNDAVTAAP